MEVNSEICVIFGKQEHISEESLESNQESRNQAKILHDSESRGREMIVAGP